MDFIRDTFMCVTLQVDYATISTLLILALL